MFDDDIEAVFLDEVADDALVSGATQRIIIDQDIEVVNEDGTIDQVAYVMTARRGLFVRGQGIDSVGKSWRVGRLLERSPDGALESWEMVAA